MTYTNCTQTGSFSESTSNSNKSNFSTTSYGFSDKTGSNSQYSSFSVRSFFTNDCSNDGFTSNSQRWSFSFFSSQLAHGVNSNASGNTVTTNSTNNRNINSNFVTNGTNSDFSNSTCSTNSTNRTTTNKTYTVVT